MLRQIIKIAVISAALLAVVTLPFYRQDLTDWWRLKNYEPEPAIAQLAERTQMSDQGRKYFFVSYPEINDKDEFNKNCPSHEKAHVLGCYTQQRIYILNIDRLELDGIMEVTAAHEMLHAAYERLSARERNYIIELLEDEFAQINDQTIISLIERYEEAGGVEARHDELHSILPTQVAELSSELEAYFARYFDDRQRVVGLYKQYESTFVRLNNQIDSMQNQIERLRTEIDNAELQLETLRQQIETMNQQLARYEQRGDVQSYNALVPQQNAAVDRYNNLLDYYRGVISRHNRLVEDLNEIVLLQNELVRSMDSNYQSL